MWRQVVHQKIQEKTEPLLVVTSHKNTENLWSEWHNAMVSRGTPPRNLLLLLLLLLLLAERDSARTQLSLPSSLPPPRGDTRGKRGRARLALNTTRPRHGSEYRDAAAPIMIIIIIIFLLLLGRGRATDQNTGTRPRPL